MRLLLAAIALVLAASPASADGRGARAFAFVSSEGEPLPLVRFAGRPPLLVDTASLCCSAYRYGALQRLWRRYRDSGLVVLGVLSDDFGGQEPGSNAQIETFCETNVAVDFPVTEKMSVSGPSSHPLFPWLRRELGESVGPRWNFHESPIGPDGRAVAARPSGVEPDGPPITAALERLPAPAAPAARS